MDRERVIEVLKELAGANVRYENQPEWVSVPCLLSRWRHANGVDHNPSAGISVHDDDISIFHCYSCKAKGSIAWLARQLEAYTGLDYNSASYEDEELFSATVPEWDMGGVDQPLGVPIDKKVMFGLFDAAVDVAEARRYLQNRGISKAAALKMELLFDPIGRTFEGKAPREETWTPRILFPVYAPNGDLHGFSGRAIRDAELKVRDYLSLPKRALLLGSHLLSGADKVIVVEGLFDYARLVTLDYPAVAAMHSSITALQADILRTIALPTYAMLDNDTAGRQGTLSIVDQLCQYVPVMRCSYPDGVKDPGELYRDEVQWMLDGAILA